MNAKDLLYQIALTKIVNVGPVLSKTLISYCGGVEAIFSENLRALTKIPNIGPALAKNIYSSNPEKLATKELNFVRERKIKALFYLDQNYPARLKNYEDSPILLYFKGSSDLNHKKTISIVGTRKPSTAGKVMCEKLVYELAAYKPLIISGLAYGVDITAHKKCLELSVPTLGVLAHGLDRIYPSQHKRIAQMMIERGGLLTEFGSETLPDREHFPMRNRIIAGMSDATVVVESKKSGGSIITADFANAYNKDVFAFPGRVSDENSKGCNALIKQHKAHLIESADDIAYILRWEEGDGSKAVQKELFINLDFHEKKLVNLLRQNGTMGIDVINSYLSLPMSELAKILLELEFKGAIRSVPGKRYMAI